MKRIDAAGGLAVLLWEICEELQIFTFSEKTVQVPPRHEFGLMDAIVNSQLRYWLWRMDAY